MATFPIYEIYIELADYEPKMWRRFQVMNDITIAKLGYIIMTLYEMRNNYSYEFRKDELENYLKKHKEYANHPERLAQLNKKFKKNRYGITAKKNLYTYKKTDGYEELKDATAFKISDVLMYPKDEIIFYYDPEINWKFNIVLEKVFIDKKVFVNTLPKVLAGSGFGIVEDCGGSKKLEQIREKLKKANWRNIINYEYYATYGENDRFKIDNFNIDDMNFRIKNIPKVLKERYEKNFYPSNRAVKIMKRKYRVYKK